ncbi:hypothetical protein K439DRAFT_1634393 [Ramaria rubella]|nr:hypothetical protein K439DRAFT_1634393 [Ramaria rubella]
MRRLTPYFNPPPLVYMFIRKSRVSLFISTLSHQRQRRDKKTNPRFSCEQIQKEKRSAYQGTC